MRWKISGRPAEFADQNHGSLLEDKGAALALHYRMAPSLRVAAEELIVQLLVNRNDLHYLAGNMVFEIKPRSVDKGVAITRFLDEPPFAGRMPIFLGDDVTDEDGFRVVKKRRWHFNPSGQSGEVRGEIPPSKCQICA